MPEPATTGMAAFAGDPGVRPSWRAFVEHAAGVSVGWRSKRTAPHRQPPVVEGSVMAAA